jgi:predicted P-loop ATPase
MEFARRADVQALKAFITRVSDFVRPAYARSTRDFPRQSVIIGTINPDSGGAYLRDTTGNRRFWPVTTGKIGVEKLRQDRDQLWAEAVQRYHSGELYHLADPELIRLAEVEQADRTVEDSWVEIIGAWMRKGMEDETLPERVTSTQVGYEALNLTARQLDRTAQVRISHALISLGWERGKFHIPSLGKTGNGFRRKIDSLEGL